MNKVTTIGKVNNHGATEVTAVKRRYPFVAETTADSALPFISAAEVQSRTRPSRTLTACCGPQRSCAAGQEYWIVIDHVVYDCTEFISEHPGGEQVIFGFLGADCSWQFWRFHGKDHMEQHGRALRVGRTQGVENRFPEPPRFVGLSRLGDNDW
jgi:Cytochrome b5-like Heme/Steroid binding domain